MAAKGLLFFGCVLVLAMAGCAGQGTGQPELGDSLAPTTTMGTNMRANFTECTGTHIPINVPSELVEDDMPTNYTLWHGLGLEQHAGLLLEILSCAKVSLDGVDVGPGRVMMLGAAVNTPAGAGIEQPSSLFVLEIATSHAGLLEWLTTRSSPTYMGVLDQAYTPYGPPPSLAQAEARVSANGSMIYSAWGVLSQATSSMEEVNRFYYGENPAADYWDTETYGRESSDYPGTLGMAADSRLARALEQGGVIPVAVASIHEASRVLVPGIDSST